LFVGAEENLRETGGDVEVFDHCPNADVLENYGGQEADMACENPWLLGSPYDDIDWYQHCPEPPTPVGGWGCKDAFNGLPPMGRRSW
jgi:hypothetical protein